MRAVSSDVLLPLIQLAPQLSMPHNMVCPGRANCCDAGLKSKSAMTNEQEKRKVADGLLAYTPIVLAVGVVGTVLSFFVYPPNIALILFAALVGLIEAPLVVMSWRYRKYDLSWRIWELPLMAFFATALLTLGWTKDLPVAQIVVQGGFIVVTVCALAIWMARRRLAERLKRKD